MKNLKYAFIGWLVLVITGCNAVYTSHPIGEKPVKLEVEDWEGTWLSADGFLVAKVTDSEMGILQVGFIGENKKGLEYETHDVYIRVKDRVADREAHRHLGRLVTNPFWTKLLKRLRQTLAVTDVHLVERNSAGEVVPASR